MELKKSPKADLENKKGIFSLAGLAVSILLMIGAFSYSKAELVFEEIAAEEAVIEVTPPPVTRQEPPKVEPPKVAPSIVTDLLEIVKDNTELDDSSSIFTSEFNEDTEVIDISEIETEEEVVEEESIVYIAETMPKFKGGDLTSFKNWVQKNVEYPVIAQENNIYGTVICRFVVEKDGKVSNIEVVKSPDRSLSDACMAIIAKSPKWSPGEQQGKPVRLGFTMPVTFKLN